MSSNSYHPQYLTAAIERLNHAREYESATGDAYSAAMAEYRRIQFLPSATIKDLERAHAGMMCAYSAWAHAAGLLAMREQQMYDAHKRAESEGY